MPYNESWRDTYDAWKTRSPDDEREQRFGMCGCKYPYAPITCQYPRCDCHKFFCGVCSDVGWIEYGDIIIPCTECSEEVEEYDLDEAPQ